MSLVLDRLPEVRCIVVRGSGGIFSSDSDIEQLLHLDAAEPEAHFPRVSDLLTASTRKTSRRGGTGAGTERRYCSGGGRLRLAGGTDPLVLGLMYGVVPPERFEAEVAARISAFSWVVVQMGETSLPAGDGH